MSALFHELVISQGLGIGITFTIVFGALLLVETPHQRNATRLRAKIDSAKAQATELEEAALQQMMNRVQLALEAAEKKQMVKVESGPLVPHPSLMIVRLPERIAE